MPRAIDVARYLLKLSAEEPEPAVTPLQMQKLLYYVQGWSLAMRDRPMFDELIEAWRDGPALRPIYGHFKQYGRKRIPAGEAKIDVPLSDDDRAFVGSVWQGYRQYAPSELWRMTHREPPWNQARGGLPPGVWGEAEITHDSMKSFFREEYERQQIPGLELDRLRQADAALKQGRGVPLTEVLPKLRNAL